jgi:hypothetical protein
MKTTSTLLIILGIFATVALPAGAKYRNDTELTNFYNPTQDGNWNQNPQIKSAAHAKFRNLMSELGVALAPSFLSPAETLGYMGSAIGINYGITTIKNSEPYWTEGMHGSPGFALQTIGFEFRKGMWFPLPGFEIGGGLKYLTESHMYAPHVMAKFSLNEGYFKWPLPAMAIRGYGSRVMGNTEVDITIASVDVSFSKSFGLSSTINVTPYLGYNYLMIIPDSKVIDFTPGIDPLGDSPYSPGVTCSNSDCNNNDLFSDQGVIVRHRIFVGTRIIYYHMFITLEAIFALQGDSAGEFEYYNGGLQTDIIKDSSQLQMTLSLSLGWNY